MKKIFAIIVCCIYTLATIGIGVEQFYCCGKLKSTDFTTLLHKHSTTEDACAKDGYMKNCCKTKFIALQVKDSHMATDAKCVIEKYFSGFICADYFFEYKAPVYNQQIVSYSSNAPPLFSGQPLYIMNCVYRI